jgi:hypothetical protein
VSWLASGGNKYETTVAADSTLNMVTVNGVIAQKAAGANPDSANGGWKTYRSVRVARDTIRNMPAGMVGKKFIIRQNDWTIMYVIATQQFHDTVVFKTWFSFNIGGSNGLDQSKDNFGWKPYDDTAYIDRNNEFCYTGGKLHMMLPTGGEAVQYSAVDTLFDNAGHSGTTITNLKFTGGNQFAIYGSTSDNILISNCTFDDMGAVGIAFYRLSNSLISSNTFTDIMSVAIYVRSVTNPYNNNTINSNDISRVGKMEGMGSWHTPADYSGMGLSSFSGLTVKYNYIHDVGDCGIKWNGSDVELAYNNVVLFCQLLQDHAAYYSYWDLSSCGGVPGNCVYYRNRWLHNNFASYGMGNNNGTPNTTLRANIIYMDGVSGWTTIDSNYGYNYARAGLNFNMDSSITARGNIMIPGDSTPFLNARAVGIQQWGPTINNLLYSNNISILSATTQASLAFTVPSLSTAGNIDTNYVNYYASPVWKKENAPTGNYTHSGFTTLTGFGSHDVLLPNVPASQYKFLQNWSASSSVVALDGIYTDVYGTAYVGTITLAPYTAAYITYSGVLPPVGGGSTIQLPFRLTP